MEKVDVQQERRFYVTSKILNNALLGVPHDWLMEQMALADIVLDCDLNNCYLCITGIERAQYLIAHQDESTYFLSEYSIKAFLNDYFAVAGYTHEFFYHSVTKEQCIVFSPKTNASVSPEQAAQDIHAFVCREIDRTMPDLKKRCCNFTVLSTHIDAYEQIPNVFQETCALKRKAFFHMQPVMFDQTMLESLRCEASLSEVDNQIVRIADAMISRERSVLLEDMDHLFLCMLKRSFSMKLVEDACSALRIHILRWQSIYNLDLPESRVARIRPDEFCSIEMLYAMAAQVIQEIVEQIDGKNGTLSYLTRETIRFVKANLAQPLSLASVAEHLNVSSVYLSRIVKRDLNETFSNYLLKERMQVAAKLLSESSMRIRDIAMQTGFQDAVYFHRCFRRHWGMTPQQFREQDGDGK